MWGWCCFPQCQENWWQESCGKCAVAVLTSSVVLACCLKRHFPVYPKSSGLPGRREAVEVAQQGWDKEGLEPGSSSAALSGACESVCLSALSIFVCN